MCIVPPRLTAEPDQQVVEGNDVMLKCNVTGNPYPVIIWRRNGSVITESTKYSVNEVGLLKIQNVSIDDAGIYECIGVSSKGRDAVNITLSVLST